MKAEDYHFTLQELLSLYRLANCAAMAAVPNYTEYEDSYAIMVRVNGAKGMVVTNASGHRGLAATLLTK